MKHTNVLISFFVVLVVSGVIAYVYIGPKSSEGSNNLESRVSEQLVIVGHPGDEQEIGFMIIHIGTAEVTISEIRVDNILNSSSPGWIGNRTLIPGQTGYITLYGLKYLADGFTEGESYQFRFTTGRGNSFYCVVGNEIFTSVGTEQLDVQGATFSGTSGDAANTIVLSVQNTGSADLTVDKYKLGLSGTQHDITDVAVAQGASTTVTCTTGADGEAWTTGTTYDIYLISATGKQFPYRATSP